MADFFETIIIVYKNPANMLFEITLKCSWCAQFIAAYADLNRISRTEILKSNGLRKNALSDYINILLESFHRTEMKICFWKLQCAFYTAV